MKAALFGEHGGPEVITFEDVPDPKPQPDEVLVRVRACALNHLDIWLRKGIPAYRLQLPHVVGSDVSGEVAAVGQNVTGINVGDKVVINPGITCGRCEWCAGGQDSMCNDYNILGARRWGGYAELVAVPARNVCPMPDGLSFEEAAAFPLTFLTAWHMLVSRAKLKPGETVLILAAGSGVGSAAVQIAKLCGARVIATAGTDEKCQKAKELGADEVINHSKALDFSEDVKRMTHGRGVDVVFEHVGAATFESSLRSLAKMGRLVTCGATTGPEAKFDIRFLFVRQLQIIGSMMGTTSEFLTILKLVGQKKLRPIVDRALPLSEAAQAQKLLEDRNQFGKLVLVP